MALPAPLRLGERGNRWTRSAGEQRDLVRRDASAHVTDVVGDGDLVIAVCDNAHEDLTGHTADQRSRPRLHWSVPDPVRVNTDAAFEAAYTDLAGRIDRLAPALTPGADHA